MFEDMGWLRFIELDEFVYPDLVREFYANLGQTDVGMWVTTVSGHNIPVNDQVINRILCAPDTEVKIFAKKGWPNMENREIEECMRRLTGKRCHYLQRPQSKYLTLPAKVVSHILGYSVYPISGHRNTAGCFLYYITDCLITRRRISLGHIVMQHMLHVQEKGDVPLPYGEVITRILHIRRPNLLQGNRIKSTETLNAHTLRQMRIIKTDGQWKFQDQRGLLTVSYAPPVDEVEAEVDAAAAAAEAAESEERVHEQVPLPRRRFVFTEDHYNNINDRLDNLSLAVTNIQQAQASFHEFMYAHFRPPPPPPPPPSDFGEE